MKVKRLVALIISSLFLVTMTQADEGAATSGNNTPPSNMSGTSGVANDATTNGSVNNSSGMSGAATPDNESSATSGTATSGSNDTATSDDDY